MNCSKSTRKISTREPARAGPLLKAMKTSNGHPQIASGYWAPSASILEIRVPSATIMEAQAPWLSHRPFEFRKMEASSHFKYSKTWKTLIVLWTPSMSRLKSWAKQRQPSCIVSVVLHRILMPILSPSMHSQEKTFDSNSSLKQEEAPIIAG